MHVSLGADGAGRRRDCGGAHSWHSAADMACSPPAAAQDAMLSRYQPAPDAARAERAVAMAAAAAARAVAAAVQGPYYGGFGGPAAQPACAYEALWQACQATQAATPRAGAERAGRRRRLGWPMCCLSAASTRAALCC
jgi:hypothetical protein